MYSFGRFHGKTNLDLIEHLKSECVIKFTWYSNDQKFCSKDSRSKIIKSDKVFQTMCQVDRGKYIHSSHAYLDAPQSIGFGATISAPHMHGYALEYLADKLNEGGRALDIGSGSGYLTTCMASMVGQSGLAVGIEHIPQLQEIAKKNIESDHHELLQNGQILLIVGDGRLGYPLKGPYDAIHIGAAASEVSEILISQLASGGRMIVPIGKKNEDQTLYQIDKTIDGEIIQKSLMGVVYVPLTDKEKQFRS